MSKHEEHCKLSLFSLSLQQQTLKYHFEVLVSKNGGDIVSLGS